MTTDPGDLVLDPTCGSGTTAYVAEQWGRRWITIDTSRVALALVRARVMGARYPYYLLADSAEGRAKERAVSGRSSAAADPPEGNLRRGFVYERVPHVTLKSIANNAEIDALHARHAADLDPLRARLNAALGTDWAEWQVPRTLDAATPDPRPETPAAAPKAVDAPSTTVADGHTTVADGHTTVDDGHTTVDDGHTTVDDAYTTMNAAYTTINAAYTTMNAAYTTVDAASTDVGETSARAGTPAPPVAGAGAGADKNPAALLAEWWRLRVARQKAIDASIARAADPEFLYDRPYEDRGKVRVAGPFTVESLSPHRVVGVDEDGRPLDPLAGAHGAEGADARASFTQMVLTQLSASGVQQADKRARLRIDDLAPRPGAYVAAEGMYREGDGDAGRARRVGVLIGPEFGTVMRVDLLAGAREAHEAGMDLLVAAGFAFDPHAESLDAAVPVLQARMNADLHMAGDLAATEGGNAFVVFGEADVEVLPPEGADDGVAVADCDRVRVRVRGVDVYNPATGEVVSGDADDPTSGAACWFVDTDYDGESFFVRQAYFIGAADPYGQLRTTLRAEIDPEAWETVRGDTNREFPKPRGGRIAVKVINHLGDEVMRVMRVE